MLEGDLGTGKTTFSRAFIRAKTSADMQVVSPTFMLVQDYPLPQGGAIWHYDLYRVKHGRELDELGIDEALSDGITLIEWPEIVKKWLPDAALRVEFLHREQGRDITLYGDDTLWKSRLPSLTELKA